MLKQSVEGKPWRVFTDDTYLAETAKLLGAIQLGVTLTEPRVSVSHTLGERTKERALVTQQKRDIKKEERQNCTYYVQKSETKIDYLCCKQLMCSSVYKCSKTTTNNIVTIQFLETSF